MKNCIFTKLYFIKDFKGFIEILKDFQIFEKIQNISKYFKSDQNPSV